MRTFLCIAYRFGQLNGHQYIFHVGQDEEAAINAAKAEAYDRGGKYGCLVQAWIGHKSCDRAYFESSRQEKAPFHNYKLDMYQSLGHAFEGWAKGSVGIPEPDPTLKDKDGKPMMVIKYRTVEPPSWVIDKALHEQAICKAIEKIQDEI